MHRNGTFVASTQEMVLEGSRLFNWSVLVTPVRPLNLTQQFKERWAQLSGPANCTCAAAPFWLSPSLTEAAGMHRHAAGI